MKKARYERMLPHELEAALEECPVAYVPFGSLEWHGKHLPTGTDSLKAYDVCLLAARRFGGVVLPATYWGRVGRWHPWTMPDFGEALCEELYTTIFRGVAENGFKVAIGITGHNDPRQTDLVKKAAGAIQRETGMRTYGMNEYDLCEDKDIGGDHAAKWETSFILALEPDLVEMDRIADDDIETGRRSSQWWKSVKDDVIAGIERLPEDHPYKHRDWLRWEPGIDGLDPREHARDEVGAYAVEQVVDSLGLLARKLLSECAQG